MESPALAGHSRRFLFPAGSLAGGGGVQMAALGLGWHGEEKGLGFLVYCPQQVPPASSRRTFPALSGMCDAGGAGRRNSLAKEVEQAWCC